jgi:hypothetical protein
VTAAADDIAEARAALMKITEPINRPAIERAMDTPRGRQALGWFAVVMKAAAEAVQALDGRPKRALAGARALIDYANAMDSFAKILAELMVEEDQARGVAH